MTRDFKQYYLHTNKTSFLPNRFIILDTETKITENVDFQRHNLKLAWTCYISGYKNNSNFKENWEYWVKELDINTYIKEKSYKKQVLYIFAHNAFFDLQVIQFYKYFCEWGWKVNFFYEKGLTYLLCIQKDKYKIKIISTTNYFPQKLKSLGDMLGLKKLKVDFNNVTNKKLSQYCKRDVKIVKLLLLKYFIFLKKHDLGNFSMTRASQSMKAYRHRFMLKKIGIHKEQDIINLERASYSGGRTECFKIGKQKGKHFVTLDINSMYPYIMKTYPLPNRLVNYRENYKVKDLEWLLKKYCCIAEVIIKTDKPIYAVKYKGKLIYPVGYFRTFLCTGGLKKALYSNHIKKLIKVSIYTKEYLFTDYVDYFFNLRNKYKEKNNHIYNNFCKLFMNSLYGKFGQRVYYQKYTKYHGNIMFNRSSYINTTTGKQGMETIIMGTHIIDTHEKLGSNTFVAIPAHITEYARLLLYDIIESVGLNRVLYCDTDSIKIKAKDMNMINYEINNKKLGALKVETISETLVINSNKDYTQDNSTKLKGIPKSALKIDNNTFSYLSFLSQLSHLNKNETNSFLVRRITKTLSRVYDKGKIDKYGNVTPIKFYRFKIWAFLHSLWELLLKSLLVV